MPTNVDKQKATLNQLISHNPISVPLGLKKEMKVSADGMGKSHNSFLRRGKGGKDSPCRALPCLEKQSELFMDRLG